MEEYMLPCLNKTLFGFECMGCGFQRSAYALSKGNISEAFNFYPAIFTIIVLLVFFILHLKFKFKNGHKYLLGLYIINILIIIASYTNKLNTLFYG